MRNSTILGTGENTAGIVVSNTSNADSEKSNLIIENCTISAGTAVEVKHTDAVITNSNADKSTGIVTLTNCKLYDTKAHLLRSTVIR